MGDFKVVFLKIFLGHSPQTLILGKGLWSLHRPAFPSSKFATTPLVITVISVIMAFLVGNKKQVAGTYFADDTDVLYNKFSVDGSSPPINPPNSDYSCAVATADHWKAVRCDEGHHAVCHSDHLIPGIVTASQPTAIYTHKVILVV